MDDSYDEVEVKLKKEEKEKRVKKDQKISGRSVFELKKIIMTKGEEKGREEDDTEKNKED